MSEAHHVLAVVDTTAQRSERILVCYRLHRNCLHQHVVHKQVSDLVLNHR